jgi:hypothetical protein
MPTGGKMEVTVLPIHFEDRSGAEFERLSFAYLLRIKHWKYIDWYGQLGKDRGRDIYGTIETDEKAERIYVYQCANHQKIALKKAKEDIEKILKGPKTMPDSFILIVGGRISGNLKDKIIDFAKSKGIYGCEVWSGIEFEERLRRDTPDLIKRFVEGVPFPETAKELKSFVFNDDFSDIDILQQFSTCFDRPAFRTRFWQESSLPAFKKAITDTIEALNTGIYRLRDGTIIKRIKSVHAIKNPEVKATIKEIIKELEKLRYNYDKLLRNGEIKLCGCNKPECPVHYMSDKACRVMDDLRFNILIKFKEIYPEFPFNNFTLF